MDLAPWYLFGLEELIALEDMVYHHYCDIVHAAQMLQYICRPSSLPEAAM
ncbi:hypothetical protein BCR41DRAFT_396520 [Lobosporangium transversale]|uniref:Uncharacterized protein n=1 Tax=Lobosporangium transversale TaxID=64571 RepID=A0A1Y2GMP7_9FUNG|nr:hypothetical protein BCR41DRAFT_396520 [Lobosporangium transversale]ORZ15557.1 hypothetical protein BCR41DRAFT_396520 [Lobosporangium transversale]|eukprot:XP_021881305.1 hypothetical protein BCR41DRAFT_396520 [Lobosporangium transversale]